MWYVSSNRDETRYEDPDRFDVTRNPEHQAFGAGGRHFCLGTALARLELQILFEETLARYPEMELAGDAAVRRVAVRQPAEDAAGDALDGGAAGRLFVRHAERGAAAARGDGVGVRDLEARAHEALRVVDRRPVHVLEARPGPRARGCPALSKTWSSSCRSSSASAYWNPEQPPPRTPTRRPDLALRGLALHEGADLLGCDVGELNHLPRLYRRSRLYPELQLCQHRQNSKSASERRCPAQRSRWTTSPAAATISAPK